MSLTAKLKPYLAEIKVHKQVSKLTSTERRLNQMTAIILNKKMAQSTKDKLLKDIVAESQVEAALRKRGVNLAR